MADDHATPAGPDLAQGLPAQHLRERTMLVGHAEGCDEIEVEGDIDARDCLLRYKRAGKVLAVGFLGRDVDNLRAEVAMERATSA